MKKHSFFKSFRNTLVVMTLLSTVLPAVLFSTVLVTKIQEVTRAAALKELDIRADNITADLSHRLDLIRSRLTTLASNRDVALATRKSAIGIGHYLSGRTPDYFFHFLKNFPLVSDIYLSDVSGQVVLRAPERVTVDIDPSITEAVIKTISSPATKTPDNFILCQKRTSENSPPTALIFVIPVVLDVTQEVTGALVATLPLAGMKQFASAQIIHPTRLEFLASGHIVGDISSQNQNSSEAALIFREATLELPTPDSGNTIEYTVRVSEPPQVRFQGVDKTITHILAYLLISLALVIGVVYLVTRRLTDAIHSLSEVVNAYAKGQYHQPLPNVTFSEFQQIVLVLKEMGDRIMRQITGLQKAEKKYRGIFEHVSEGIFQSTREGRFISANPSMSQIFGYDSPADLILSVHHIPSQLFVDSIEKKALLKLLNDTDRLAGQEARMIKKNGDVFWISMSIRVVRDNNGLFVCYEGSMEDITARKQAEEKIKRMNEHLERRVQDRTHQLEATNKALTKSIRQLNQTQTQLVQSEKMAALGSLVAGVAHEINTPVGVGVTAASFLDRQTSDAMALYASGSLKRSDLEKFLNTTNESAKMIMTNLNRAADLISSFKQVAVDQSSEEIRDFNLRLYIEELLISLQPELKRTPHLVDINCPEDIVIKSFPGAFSQVMTNLIMNSIIHGFENTDAGTIQVDVSADTDNLNIAYQDNGKGMPPETAKMIFDPFFTTTRGQGGTGLGMHITWNIVTQTLGGEIICRSTEGQGTKFIITIPLNSAQLTSNTGITDQETSAPRDL